MPNRKIISVVMLSMLLLLSGCTGAQETTDDKVVPVTWEQNASTAALQKLLPLTIKLSPYGGFEQVGAIGQNIVSADKQITTQYGDIVLYAGNKLVIFYGSNSWAYTRLGHIDMSKQELTALLNRDGVTVQLVAQ